MMTTMMPMRLMAAFAVLAAGAAQTYNEGECAAETCGTGGCYDQGGNIAGTPNACICREDACNEDRCANAGGIWTDGCNSKWCDPVWCANQDGVVDDDEVNDPTDSGETTYDPGYCEAQNCGESTGGCYDSSGTIDGTPNRCTCTANACNEDRCSAAGGIWTEECTSAWCDPVWCEQNAVTEAPTASPDDAGTSDLCFSALNSVEVQGKGMISMDSLEIGDYVRSGKDFSRVFSFGHLEPDAEAIFLQIHTEGSAAPLEITDKHMVFRNDKAVRAEEVLVGDMLGDNKVIKITSAKRTGLYAPITYDGSIVVTGIKSSCYVQFLDHVPADQHQFVHMFFSLQRVACSVNFGWCAAETYTDGLSDYSSWAIKTYSYCNQFGAPVQWLLTVICGLILPTWYFAEQLYLSPILFAVGFLLYKSTKKSA